MIGADPRHAPATGTAESAWGPREACVHEIFEAQAAQTPEAIALVCDGQELSYGALNARANQIARGLRAHGVGPEAPVGLCVERSLEMVAGILGILKAGGAYVPCDPSYPRERLAFLLEDSRAPVLLTQRHLVERLPARQAQVLCLDAGGELGEQESGENLSSGARPDNLAYVIYTSGSTGRPKGVLVAHRNITRLFAATDAWFAFDERDVWTLFHSIAFDFSVWELWGALLHGGRLVVMDRRVARSPEAFAALLVREKVTVLNQTPSAFYQLMPALDAACERQDELAVRLVIFGGEALDPARLRPWVGRHGDARPRLVNMYGITETTVHVTYHALTAQDVVGGQGSPIGGPIPDLQVHILDARRERVAVGMVGEMYVGGAGLARGYLNRAELTAERFIPDPFSAEPGARLYRTGDLGRYRADGSIDFAGRIDHQVKIRGFRIELGEIEAVLARHPRVREVVAAARPGATGDPDLVAYVVQAAGQGGFDGAALRRHVQEHLPDYMVPAAIVPIGALPLTVNGKVDRRALPAPGRERAGGGATFAAPQTPVQRQLAQIWEALLGKGPIGIRDDFFDLGGNSLLVVRLLHTVERTWGKKVPEDVFFAGATIERLAQVLLEHDATAVRSPLTPIQPSGSKAPFFFLHGNFGGSGLYCHTMAQYLDPDQPFYALQPHGFDGGKIPGTIEAMAASYLDTVQGVQPEGPYLLGGVCNGGIIAFEMARQLEARGHVVALVVLVVAVQAPLWARVARVVVGALGNLMGLAPERQVGHYGQLCYYVERLGVHARAGLAAQIGVVQRTMGRGIKGMTHLGQAARRGALLAGRGAPDPEGDEPTSYSWGTYRWAIAGYRPRRFAGRITLLWPRDQRADFARTARWRAAAGEVERHFVPGTHDTCTESQNIPALAAEIRACLTRAHRAEAG